MALPSVRIPLSPTPRSASGPRRCGRSASLFEIGALHARARGLPLPAFLLPLPHLKPATPCVPELERLRQRGAAAGMRSRPPGSARWPISPFSIMRRGGRGGRMRLCVASSSSQSLRSEAERPCDLGRRAAMLPSAANAIPISKAIMHTPRGVHIQPSMMRFWCDVFVDSGRRPPRRESGYA